MSKARWMIAALSLMPVPSHASYTECTAIRAVALETRPNGGPEPRWSPVEKGSAVAIRQTYRDWVFVVHHIQSGEGEEKAVTTQYGWLPRKSLNGCKLQDGTP